MRRMVIYCFLTSVFAAWFHVRAAADIVILKSGGRIEGEVIDRGDQVEVRIKSNVSTTIARKDIKEIIIQKSPRLIYEERASQLAGDDALGHYHLGLWCRDQGLKLEAKKQFEKTISIEPGHEEARKALGHEKIDGKWLSHDEVMRRKGFVKYRNKWLPKKEAEARRKADELVKNIRGLVKKIEKAGDVPPAAAIDNLSGISHPAALDALTRELRSRNSHVRTAVATSLGLVGDKKPGDALLKMALEDRNSNARAAAAISVNLICKKTRNNKLLNKLIQTMFKQGFPRKREAAAEAIGFIGEKRFITHLIKALVITIQVKSKEEDLNPFDPATEKDKKRLLGGTRVRRNNPGGGVSVGTAKDNVKTKPWKNIKAHQALKKITGQDFGYNQKQWKEWYYQDLEKRSEEDESEEERNRNE